ncbi:hypothetical protein RU639_008559 [Aspergillus parasiticus]
MTYTEYRCILCGVSFNIGRIRTTDEPPNFAWAGHGANWVDALCDDKGKCSTEKTGCFYILRVYNEAQDAETSGSEGYLFFEFEEGQPLWWVNNC